MACEKVSHTLTKEGNKWVMTAELNMVNPDDFVQFWIEDAHAENELYYLSTSMIGSSASLKEVLQISSQPTAMGIARCVLCEIKNA